MLLGIICLSLALHYWLSDRNAVMRALFTVQAPIARLSAKCSEGAPDWLGEMTSHGIVRLKALSTQVAFVDEQGKLSHCETGWKSTMLLSEMVDQDTRFRYGSLTKPITAAKVLDLVKEEKLTLQSALDDLFSMPEGTGSVGDVTVGQLLSHRSGIRGQIFVNNMTPVCPYALSDLISSGNVGSVGDFQYSNLGYCILGEVIAVATGRSYRSAVESSYYLSERNIGYVQYDEAVDEVERDFRFNDFYGRNLKGRFDYDAISSTAGMSGSASAYALLLRDLIKGAAPDFFYSGDCDSSVFKKCYGYAFYEYSPVSEKAYQIKEGYLPGASGVAVINENREIFVWLGNSDTDNAAAGQNMKGFLAELAKTRF
ncbi:CubicO group peptidase, beta-lactamase class C family [Marinobacter daqiaonensis]|uniref:CubicO group peptidase, beta-lactamase class C family n=2 Tax=Marinobacter daqiaonensis TaxID=650891 RepID=A0A1I6HB88_9GAMM|nr:CubicO group peptidase, beta-lactamase class C family [Marinobacter daqiaonensis]